LSKKLSLKEYEPDGATIGSIRLVGQNYMTDWYLVNDYSIFSSKRFKKLQSFIQNQFLITQLHQSFQLLLPQQARQEVLPQLSLL
jgi:hypothetical protein